MSRVFARKQPRGPIAGLREEGEVVDVTSFGREAVTVSFRAEGEPSTDDFVLTRAAWERLGEPERLRVTVEAV